MKREGKQTELILIVDLLALVFSFLVTMYLDFKEMKEYLNFETSSLFFIMLTIYFAIFIVRTSGRDFCSRKASSEFGDVLLRVMILVAMSIAIIFFIDEKRFFTRSFFVYFSVILLFSTFMFRMWLKSFMIHKYYDTSNGKRLVIVTTSGMIQSFLKRAGNKFDLWEYKIVGWILLDENPDMIGREIDGFPIIGTYDNMYTCVSQSAVDEIFIYIPYTNGQHVAKAIEEYEDMGITVNLNVNVFDLNLRHRKKEIRSLGNFFVISFSQTITTAQMVIVKRIMDIVGSIVGLFITAIITVIVSIPLLIESPGPLFFAQTRVGRNGRQFKIYKFRSMYKDAEERKKELLEKNEMNGLMFKMENDPRITKVGRFIRKYSIDELPQFWNVLKGDMSLVGTRPPTLDEFMQYENRYKRRLSCKPGITGLWQVSGRSDIKDFEDVLALDLEYIDNWSLALDIKLLIKTFYVALFAKGAR